MKKITLMALALLLCASASNAQIRFGVKAGANMSNFSTESNVIDQVKGATNYQFGLLLQAKAFGFVIQPEVLYSVKSGEFNNSTLSGILSGTDTEYQSHNIEIPVNLQFGLEMGPARVFLQGGPYVSFLAGALINGSSDDYETVKEYISTFDYGLGLGAGVELLRFQLTAKYDWGLSPLGKEQLLLGENVNPFNELKNRNFNISLAYLF
jgi:hypothetical protein